MIDINRTDGYKHSVGLYCIDWLGSGSIVQKVEVFDYADSSFSNALDTGCSYCRRTGLTFSGTLKATK